LEKGAESAPDLPVKRKNVPAEDPVNLLFLAAFSNS
jgi:hypothetical protein